MLNANNAADLNRQQILDALETRYFSMLPTRLPNRSLEEQRKDRFSRAIAAFAIQKLSGCSETEAVAAVVDCGDDNGIDAIFYSRWQNTLWLLQSKYGDAPDRASNLTFCNGVSDLLAERYDRFYQSGNNPEFDRVQADIEDALGDVSTKIVACVAYLGNSLGVHATADLEQLKAEKNEAKDWFDWRDIGLPVQHGWLAEEQANTALDVTLTLERWNHFRGPHRAVYGLVGAAQLNTLYQQYGNALFQKNIRHFLGNQQVNLAIAETIQAQPDELFYLNNGLTVICSRFDYAGDRGDQNTFTVQKFSVVNGAQTVGSIGLAARGGEIPLNARVLITILEIGEGEAATALGKLITRARNTQNAIHRNDFAALDTNQERLRQELAISDVVYTYRPSADVDAGGQDQFSLDDATRALACFSGDTQTIVTAKKEISLVYDGTGPFYSRLFRDDLSGAQLYRRVQIYLYADQLFENSENTEAGRRQMFFRHGRLFILHIWARRNRAMLNKPELLLSEDDKLHLSADFLELAERIYTVAETMFAATDKGYLKIFRNLTDAEPLARTVMQELNRPAVDEIPGQEI